MEDIYKEVALELGEKKDLVEEIYRSIFSMISDTLEAGDLKPVRLMYLGVWRCKPTRVMFLKQKGLL